MEKNLGSNRILEIKESHLKMALIILYEDLFFFKDVLEVIKEL